MTLTVLKSQIGDADYPAAVEAYRQALLTHRMTENVPAPVAPQIVASAIKRVPQDNGMDDFVADYEIVDDTPPPPEPYVPTLEDRKREALIESQRMEAEASAKLIAPERRRLADMDYYRTLRVPEANRSPQQLELIAKRQELDDALEQLAYEAAQREAAIAEMT